MPRAVGPWLHRVCIRRFGPDDPWQKLVLYTVNAFMGDEGWCDPGQEAIAEAASMGVSTVRLKTGEVSRDGWLALYPRGKEGQKWKSYSYRACIPDWIDLEVIPRGVELVDAHEAQWGAIESDASNGTRYPQEGKRRAPPARGGSSVEAPPADDEKHRQRTEKAPPADVLKHRQPMGGKFFSESSSLKVNEIQGALTRTAHVKAIPKESEQERTRRVEDNRRKAIDDIARLSAAAEKRSLASGGNR